MSHTLSRVKPSSSIAYLRVVAESSTCKNASFFDSFSCPCTLPSTFDKLRDIERGALAPGRRGSRAAADDHGHTMLGPQGQPRLRDHLLARHERHVIDLHHLRDNELGLQHR